MPQEIPKPIQLKDYQVSDFLIDTVDLRVDLGEAQSTVRAGLAMRRNPEAPNKKGPLVLNGREMTIQHLCLDGVVLEGEQFEADEEHLTIEGL